MKPDDGHDPSEKKIVIRCAHSTNKPTDKANVIETRLRHR